MNLSVSTLIRGFNSEKISTLLAVSASIVVIITFAVQIIAQLFKRIRSKFKFNISSYNLFIDRYPDSIDNKKLMTKIDLYFRIYNASTAAQNIDSCKVSIRKSLFKEISLCSLNNGWYLKSQESVSLDLHEFFPKEYYDYIYLEYPETQVSDVVEKYIQKNTPKLITLKFNLISREKTLYSFKYKIKIENLKRAINGSTNKPIE